MNGWSHPVQLDTLLLEPVKGYLNRINMTDHRRLAYGFHCIHSNHILCVVGDFGKGLRILQLHLEAYEVTGFN